MEQSYPLRSYANNYPSDNYGYQPPPAWWQQPPPLPPRFGPDFSVQRKPVTHVHQQSSTGYEPLSETYAGHEPFPPPPLRRKAGFFSSVTWWLPEIFASLLAITCLVAIIVLLRYYDGRSLADINLPGSLTLNGIIAAISTLARVAFMVPVASGLSQESWIWFSNNGRQQNQCRSRLKDLDISDNASRGAWGSLLFLLFARRRWIAYIGALATIISLGFGTFTQQLLAIDQFPLASDSAYAPGNLPRAETWQYFNSRPSESGGAQSLPLDLRAAVYNGMLTDKIDPITATCATGNCTWPTTPSLAVCGACSPSTYVRNCDNQYCYYKMPSGAQIRLAASHIQGIGFVVNSTSKGSIYDGSAGDRAYVAHFNAVGSPYSIPYESFSNSNITASECALWMCVKSFSTIMVAGRIQENVTMEFANLTRPTTDVTGPFDNYTFANLPTEMHPSPATTYNVSNIGMNCFIYTFYKLFNGTATLTQGGGIAENDVVEAIWNASSNLDPWIKNVAYSLTTALRYVNLSPHPPSHSILYPTPRQKIYDGEAHAVGVRVQWQWLVLPVICIVLSILFPIIIMIKTAKSPVAPWKGSLLAFLFFEVDKELKKRASGRMNERGGVYSAVGDEKVVLREDHEGKWTFKIA